MPGSKPAQNCLHKSQRFIYQNDMTPGVSLTLTVCQKSVAGFHILFSLGVMCIWRCPSTQTRDRLVHNEFVPPRHCFSAPICIVLGHSWASDLPVLLKRDFVAEANTKEKQEHVGSCWRISFLYWLFLRAVSFHICFWLPSDSMLGWVDIWINLESLLRR